MAKLPRVPAQLVLKILKRNGFYEFHQSGIHIQLRHPLRSDLRISVPYHHGDLAPKTLKSIILQADMTIEKFLDLM